MRSSKYLLMLSTAVLVAGWAGVRAASMPKVMVTTDRSSYTAGETAEVTLRTHAGGPSDVYVMLTTPSGRRLYADQSLHFSRRRAAAARNYMLADGEVKVPISLATSDLARPGEYKLEVVVTPPGAGENRGDVTATARFLVSIPGLNFLAIHNAKSPKYDPDCGGCHVDKTRSVSLGPGIPSFHTIKYKMFSAGGISHPCVICHKGADLIDQSQAALRKNVSPSFCARCHGAFNTGKRLFAK